MAIYKTPGVYAVEKSTLPPSVAEVSTAIPAFIGYTQKAISSEGKDLTNVPVRISTLLEYNDLFGGADKVAFTVTTEVKNNAEVITDVTQTADKNHRMYYALDHFFRNGGGSCYIVSVGSYALDKTAANFRAGLDAVGKEDEPTLIVLSEATTLANSQDYYDLCQAALDQCNKLMDRFAILDVLNQSAGVADFRNKISNNLKYGAAYTPYLETSINYLYEDTDVSVIQTGQVPQDTAMDFSIVKDSIKVTYSGVSKDTPKLIVASGSGDLTIEETGKTLTISNITASGKSATTGADILEAWTAYATANTSTKFAIVLNGEGTAKVTVTAADGIALASATDIPANPGSVKMNTIKTSKTALYNAIKLELNKFRVTLPPSPAVAGVYASVDRDRGVWKAPANVGLNAVIAPVQKISEQEQENLNVHPDGGKSINAIRSFAGKGTLVWGARTLAGNDNEWRYVPVRRLFNMVEESAKKASAFAVFEPNDATTWLKVKGMLDSFLYGLWQQGALAGPKPESAYFVNVGLGKTMTSQDILEGRMIVEIGIAAVRPAEFIILSFSHKLQEA